MTLIELREILGWCALINMGLLAWWLLFITLAHDWTWRFHSRWWPTGVNERWSNPHHWESPDLL